MTLQFLITALVVVAIPGTGVVFALAVGSGQGRRAALAAALGCTLGILPHICAATLGLAALLHTSALMFTARLIRWLDRSFAAVFAAPGARLALERSP